MRRWQIRAIAGLVLLMGLLSGCGNQKIGRQVSWPGLTEHNGILYVANVERLDALDAATGEWLWSYPAEDVKGMGPFYSKPVIAPEYGENGLILCAGFDGIVYALEMGATPRETPKESWKSEKVVGQYVGYGVVHEDMYIIGNGDSATYALALEDGHTIWKFEAQDRVWATPLVVDEQVYIASLDQRFYAVDSQTGALQWERQLDGAVVASPVYVNGSIWVGTFGETLYRLAPDNSREPETFALRGWLWATPVVSGNILYLADVEGNLYAFDTTTRTMVWSEPANAGDMVSGQPVLVNDGALLLAPGYEKGQLHAFDTTDGAVMSWKALENPGRLPGGLVADDTHVYLMPILIETRVQAINLDKGNVVWAYPAPPTQ